MPQARCPVEKKGDEAALGLAGDTAHRAHARRP
jgi:hypothetical protein